MEYDTKIKLVDLILIVLGILMGSIVLIIGLSMLTMLLSMTVEVVTGIDIIRDYIKPLFQGVP